MLSRPPEPPGKPLSDRLLKDFSQKPFSKPTRDAFGKGSLLYV
jgi:hypothetical protein